MQRDGLHDRRCTITGSLALPKHPNFIIPNEQAKYYEELLEEIKSNFMNSIEDANICMPEETICNRRKQ